MIKKYRFNILLAAIMCTTLLSSCTKSIQTQTNAATTQQTTTSAAAVKASSVTADMISYDSEDYYTDWNNQNPNYIELSGSSAQIKGSGATQSGNKITITKAGTYVISGKLNNGQIIVDTEDKGAVRLVLNGTDITCNNNSPIYVKNASKTIISLQAGTENKITDGKNYSSTDSDAPNAAIYSKDGLVINGTGTLIVKGNYKDGITSKDELKITGGIITINSTDDGIIGKDMVLIKAGTINIEAGGDGIKSSNDSDAKKGFVAIEGGTFNIKSGTDGIQAETSMLVNGGDFNITTGGGSAKAVAKMDDMQMGMMGHGGQNGQMNPTPTSTATTTEEESQSAKALKAASDITVKGGILKIDSLEDAIHTNNTVNIEAGEISIASGDDGIHGDSTLNIKGGKVNISKSYEGLESNQIIISGGDINVVASDDGVNASNSKDQTSTNGGPGQPNSTGNSMLNISGGNVTVNANGDGLDANGSMSMSGGTVVVNGPSNDGNGALDYDGTFEITGGTLIAVGSSGMAQAPSDQSSQNSIIMTFSNIQQAGSIVSLQDSTGKIIATFAPAKQYQSIVISSPVIKKDTSYSLYTGGTSAGTVTNGLYTDGEYKNGKKVVDFTISNSVTWLNESGVTTARSNTFGGHGGGPGGMPGRGSEAGGPPSAR